MTKFEWERQLKKGISGLPKAEQQRVLDYYNELFADKIDAGLREQYIISEFGNPYDVANKILVDFYNEGKENAEVDEYIYSSSDEIDDAFDDAPVKDVVETPLRKTWGERREERREQKAQNDKPADNAYAEKTEYSTPAVVAESDGEEDDADEDVKRKNKGAKSAIGLIFVLCVLLYFVLGACFNLWHPTWLIFLLMPCIVTLIEAINRRDWRVFAYPVFVTFLFLLIGFYTHKWHPAWVLFITIPVYYVLGSFIAKNTKNDGRRVKEKRKQSDGAEVKKDACADAEAKKAKSRDGSTASKVFSVIAKILMICCLVWVSVVVWGFVIGIFASGIGLVIGGAASFVSALVGSVDALLLGAAFAQVGLGLICTFGMVALFKPCFNMCKSFIRTIRSSFDGKEKVK